MLYVMQIKKLRKNANFDETLNNIHKYWTWMCEVYLDETEVYEITTSPGLLLGVGFGIEMTFFEHISVPFRFGINGQLLSNPGMNIGFGVGILYRF